MCGEFSFFGTSPLLRVVPAAPGCLGSVVRQHAQLQDEGGGTDSNSDAYYGGSMYYGDGTVMGSIAERTW